MRLSCAVLVSGLVLVAAVPDVAVASRAAQDPRVALAAADSAPVAGMRVTQERLLVAGRPRGFRLAVPAGARAQAPVVLLLHGGGSRQDGAAIARQTGFDRVLARNGWVGVYPDGGPTGWNAGGCCGAPARRRNDVAFFDALRHAMQRRGYDAARVGVAGFSQGAFMTQRLACERAPRIAAAVSVAGTLVTTPCRPARPVPIALIWNERDARVPPRGSRIYGRQTPSARQLDRTWRRLNGCRSFREGRAGAVLSLHGFSCRGGASVQTHVVGGADHAWPRAALGHALDANAVAEVLLRAHLR